MSRSRDGEAVKVGRVGRPHGLDGSVVVERPSENEALFVARFLPEGTQDQWRDFDELQRRSTSPENAWRFVDEFADIDVTDLAPRVTVPTLVMCARREPDNMFAESRRLAGSIPGSRLEIIPDGSHLCFAEHPEVYMPMLREFLAANE